MAKNELLTVSEFAKAIHVHPQTVRDWDRTGKVPAGARTPGGQRRYTLQQIDDYFQAIKEKSGPRSAV